MHRDNKSRLGNAGTTMAELLVGFAVFAILMTMFYGMIRLASNMLMETTDKIDAEKKYEQEYYKKDMLNNALSDEGTYFLKAEKLSEGLILKEKTDGAKSEKIEIASDFYKIYDRDGECDITVYRFVDGDIE